MEQINKVLLIDDDTVTNIMHRRMIEKSGRVSEISVATDGLAALEILEQIVSDKQALPELIFLDINMPRMNGFEFLDEYETRKLGDRAKKIIVMLTTSLLKSDQDRAESDPNVHSFANKMIQSDLFLQLVDEVVLHGDHASTH